MAASSFYASLAFVLAHEGGFVNHPRDPGGATNLGITRATLAVHRGRAVSVAEVRALTRAEAGAIYRASYWDAVRGDDLPAGLDLALFDFAVNSGPGRAVRMLQRVVDVRQDGLIGPVTLRAAAGDVKGVIARLCAARLAFLHALPTWPTFGRGWHKRVIAVDVAARRLAIESGPRYHSPTVHRQSGTG